MERAAFGVGAAFARGAKKNISALMDRIRRTMASMGEWQTESKATPIGPGTGEGQSERTARTARNIERLEALQDRRVGIGPRVTLRLISLSVAVGATLGALLAIALRFFPWDYPLPWIVVGFLGWVLRKTLHSLIRGIGDRKALDREIEAILQGNEGSFLELISEEGRSRGMGYLRVKTTVGATRIRESGGTVLETAAKQIRLIRILAEGAAIVVSILLAFAIDAWWDGAQESKAQAGYLQLLASEFRQAKTELESDLVDRDSIVSSSIALLEWTTRESTPSPDSMNVWMFWLGAYKRYQPPHAVFDNLAASGTIIHGVPDSLRAALLRYDRMRDRYRLIEEVEDRFRVERLLPYLERNTAKVRYAYEPERLPLRDVHHPSGYDFILRDREFQNLVMDRTANARTALQQGQAMDQIIEQILALLPTPGSLR